MAWTALAVIAVAVYLAFRLGLFPSAPPAPQAQPEQPSSPLNRPMPALELAGFTGTDQSVTLSDLQGRVTFISFWATWCSPCRQEFPELLELERRFHGHPDFRMLSIVSGIQPDTDLNKLRAEVSQFLRALNAKIPTYIDPTDKTHRAVVDLVVPPGRDPGGLSFPLPVTVLLDRQGIVRRLWFGYVPNGLQEMEKLIAEMLEKEAEGGQGTAEGGRWKGGRSE